tara:strand:- start:11824 stop:12063 length:240 start_codon:yes stop_codon:yes gene_type:complete
MFGVSDFGEQLTGLGLIATEQNQSQDAVFESNVAIAVRRERSAGAKHVVTCDIAMSEKCWRIAAEKEDNDQSIGFWAKQ